MPSVFDGFDKLISPAAVGGAFAEGLATGQQQRAEREVRGALSMYAADPSDPRAIETLMRHKPELALKLKDVQRETEFNEALGGYVRSQYQPPSTAALAQQGALAKAMPSAATAVPTTMAGAPAIPGSAEALAGPAATPAPAAAPHVLGTPQSDADRHFLRMLETDPAKAMEIDSKLRDNAVKRLKAADDAYDFAIARLANVSDDAQYQQLVAALEPQLAGVGINIREVVPPTFPGREGIRPLLMTALDAKEQIAALVSRERLEAYTANVEADNERADRNTDSVIADRGARRGIQLRGQVVRDRTQRRGQDIRSGDTRRGQDVRGAGRQSLPVMKTPEEALKLPKGTAFRVGSASGPVKIRP